MRIKELKSKIEEHLNNGGSENDIVVLSSDQEGNSYRELYEIYYAYCYDISQHELELSLDDNNEHVYEKVIVLV